MEKCNFHNNAAALIIAAAKKSGFLDSVAEALCFTAKNENPWGDCPACELLDDLADAFDDYICLPVITLEKFYGEGAVNPDYTEEELRSYFSVPFEIHVGTMPPRFSIDFDKVYDAAKAEAEVEAERAELMQRRKRA